MDEEVQDIDLLAREDKKVWYDNPVLIFRVKDYRKVEVPPSSIFAQTFEHAKSSA